MATWERRRLLAAVRAIDRVCFPHPDEPINPAQLRRGLLITWPEGSNPWGYLLATWREPSEIIRIGVLPEYRGKGVAEHLLHKLEGWFDKVKTYTANNNWSAINLFSRFGYKAGPVWFKDEGRKYIGWFKTVRRR